MPDLAEIIAQIKECSSNAFPYSIASGQVVVMQRLASWVEAPGLVSPLETHW